MLKKWSTMVSVFSYLEYRDFLKVHFEEQKEKHAFYSYRYISGKTGIDPSYYVKVLNKQKHVSEKKLEPLLDHLDLNGRERDYFSTLVQYNRSKSSELTKELFAKLMSLKKSAGAHISDYRYFAEWYTIPTRELLNHYDFDGDYKALAKQFHPPITERQARNAIRTLTELEMVSEDENGFLRPSEALLTTGDQWRSDAIRKFQRQMISLAGESIERFPKEERDISTVTVSTSQKCMEAVRERLAQARREILEMIAAEDDVDGVYQINLQVFPLTKGDAE